MREPEAVLTFWNLEGEDQVLVILTTFGKCVNKLAHFITLACYLEDSITAQVLAAKRATGFNYSTIQLQQHSITVEFNYIPQHYNQTNRALRTMVGTLI
ncbi:hypothetical protein LXL04_023108 [Taraxacum kok-saghyz]